MEGAYEGVMPDRRLARRARQLQEAVAKHQKVSIAGVAQDWAEQMAFYRLLSNARVGVEALAEGLCAQMPREVREAEPATEPPHLLVIQDTTQLNLQRHAGRIAPEKAPGVIGDGQSLGLFLHPSLLVEANRGLARGFSDVALWSRDPEQPNKQARNYRAQPLEEKESFRWIQAHQRSRAVCGPAARLTLVADREADLYALFTRLPEARTDVLVRACRDRCIAEGEGRLYAHLAAQPRLSCETVKLRGDVRRGRSARTAELEYRCARVHLQRPKNQPVQRREGVAQVALFALGVKERPESVPAGEEAVHWRLLSTHPITTPEEARQVVGWYRQRWHIEQVFRLLKSQGLDVESSELESAAALSKLSVLALGAALDVLRLLLAERGESEQPLEHVFDEAEQACLGALAAEVEGRTAKQQNPHRPQTLAWAAWIIARLGGWKGYRSQRRAGPRIYRRGLQRFRQTMQGWRIATQHAPP